MIKQRQEAAEKTASLGPVAIIPESLIERLPDIHRRLRRHGVFPGAEVDSALRGVRLALLEAGVDFCMAEEILVRFQERAAGSEITRTLDPALQMGKAVNVDPAAALGPAVPWNPAGYQGPGTGAGRSPESPPAAVEG
jgi:hypothetical protein